MSGRVGWIVKAMLGNNQKLLICATTRREKGEKDLPDDNAVLCESRFRDSSILLSRFFAFCQRNGDFYFM